MTPQPYQNAYDTAISELAEIAATFEQLRARKVMLEAAVQALEPFFASTEVVRAQSSMEPEFENQPVGDESVAAIEQTGEYSFRDVPSPLPDLAETGGDPFQRRVKTSFRFKGFAAQRSF